MRSIRTVTLLGAGSFAVGDLVYRAGMLLYWATLSRVVGLSSVGLLAVANAICSPLYKAFDAGFSQFAIRTFAAADAGALHQLRAVYPFYYRTALAGVPLGAAAMFVLNGSTDALWVGLLVAFAYYAEFLMFLWLAPSRARLRVRQEITTKVYISFGQAAILFALSRQMRLSPVDVALLMTFMYLSAGLITGVVWRKQVGSNLIWPIDEAVIFDHVQSKGHASSRRRFGALSIWSSLTQRVDIVLVQVLVGPVAAGAYALASKLLEASKIASWAFGRATLAVAARLSAQEPLRPALQPLLGLSVLQGLCVGAVLTLGGPDLLGLIFGSDVANAAAPVIRLMGLAAVMVSIASPLQNALLGLGAESVAMQASLWGLVTVVAAGVPMTYYFGMTGTIGAVLLSELCVLSLCARKVFRRSYSRS